MTCHFHFCFDINFWDCFQNNRGIKTFNHKFCHRPIILWKLAKLHQRLLENGCYPTKSQVLDHYQICIPFFQQTLIITIWSYRQVTDHNDKLLRKCFLYEISSSVKIPEDLSLSLVFPNHFFRTLILSNDLNSIRNTEIYYWNGLRWYFAPKLGTILPSNWLEGKYIFIYLKWKMLGKHFSLWGGNCVYISSLMVGPTTSNSFLALNGLEALPR